MVLFDAALNGQNQYAGKGYFFRRGGYRRYDWRTDRLDDGGSLPVFGWHLPGDFRDGVDAAFNGRGAYARYAYFTRGPMYVRYDWSTNRVDLGPVPLAPAWGLPVDFAFGVDTALEGDRAFAGKAYFFRGNSYVRYDYGTGLVDYRGTLAEWGLPAEFNGGVNAAVNGTGAFAGKAYFFVNDSYVRYDWASGRIDQPLTPIASIWPALLGLTQPPARRVVAYVTIDVDDHIGHHDHGDNLAGLRAAAASWDRNTYVDDRWSREVDQRVLDDPHLLGLFLAGSFDEWANIYNRSRPDWAAELRRYGGLIRTTDVPALAVCGSHQLLAATFSGWDRVGHMTPAGTPVRPISAETSGQSRFPTPRLGEVGVFPSIVNGAADPILAGLPARTMFMEYHHDSVLTPPPSTRQILLPDGVQGADQSEGKEPERVARTADRCRVQALRYDVPPAGRLLYSTQFHPELVRGGPHGAILLRNFLGLARSYWRRGTTG